MRNAARRREKKEIRLASALRVAIALLHRRAFPRCRKGNRDARVCVCVYVRRGHTRSRASAANRDLAGNLLEIHIGYVARSTQRAGRRPAAAAAAAAAAPTVAILTRKLAISGND